MVGLTDTRRGINRTLATACLVITGTCSGFLVQHVRAAEAAKSGFFVFDARAGKIERNSSIQVGMTYLRLLYAGEFFPKNPDGTKPDMTQPIESVVHKLGAKMLKEKYDLLCVDIEHWPVRGVEDSVIDESMDKYIKILDWLRADVPGVKIGCYGVPPIRNYWGAIKSVDDPTFQAWVAENKRLARFGKYSDVIFPSIYTFYDHAEGWEKYAIANIKQAKQYGKPIYPFIWPKFHNSNKKLSGQLVSPVFWRLQLETCYKYADGVCIWGYWPKGFDETEPWWLETLKFMKDKGLTPPQMETVPSNTSADHGE